MKSYSFLLFLGFLLIGNASIAQTKLMMSRTMYNEWSDTKEEWSGWPDEYVYYDEGEEPIIAFTKLDDEGINFKVEIWAPDHSEFEVTYSGFREDQNAHVYEDSAGDEVWIINSTASQLALNGWPDGKVVSIYFWIYSDDYALLLE